jgi:hypothetical protein
MKKRGSSCLCILDDASNLKKEESSAVDIIRYSKLYLVDSLSIGQV